jgi:hypothetical protein
VIFRAVNRGSMFVFSAGIATGVKPLHSAKRVMPVSKTMLQNKSAVVNSHLLNAPKVSTNLSHGRIILMQRATTAAVSRVHGSRSRDKRFPSLYLR